MEWICLFTETTRNESVLILRIRGMNQYIFWEYTEWDKSKNRFGCACLQNKQNEFVRILRIRGMNLFLYWKFAEQIRMSTEILRMHEIWISQQIWIQKWKYLRMFIRRLDGLIRLNHFTPKNLMHVYIYISFNKAVNPSYFQIEQQIHQVMRTKTMHFSDKHLSFLSL